MSLGVLTAVVSALGGSIITGIVAIVLNNNTQRHQNERERHRLNHETEQWRRDRTIRRAETLQEAYQAALFHLHEANRRAPSPSAGSPPSAEYRNNITQAIKWLTIIDGQVKNPSP